MSEATVGNKSGIKLWKIVGIITLIGVLVAVGRIVLRVFREENRKRQESAESDSGV
jgi:hypothetical protein